ncbi:MAG: glycoside hydrolase family 57 protein [Candidatus Bipolaricaulis sp.]|nr:glycoside hydrolase family 57 protein [Candidatus Bipolaricaulis sp.]
MGSQVHVAFLWHMHQPWYALPGSVENLLPWTRLRATKDYTDMAAFIARGEVPVTVNFTPCLTEQLTRYAAGSLSDGYFPATAGEGALRDLLSGAIPLPVARRGFSVPDLDRLRAAAVTPEGERALWGWFLLAWIGQTVLDGDPSLRDLAQRGRFVPDDLERLSDVHRRLVGEVLPRYRALAAEGMVELTATPFYHPILPLLLDSQVARRAQPSDPIPPFSAPDDARDQVRRALAHHEATFGGRPAGMWPAEGAVSAEAAAVFAHAGVRWIATDGAILARSLGRPPHREDLYRPWRFATGSGELTILSRDTYLSNLIGFDYHRWPAADAASDLVRRLREIGKEWHEDAPPLVLIAMDGENAWDFYERNGQPFLEALYRLVRSSPDLVPTTVSGYLDQQSSAPRALPDLWPGSWIDADFRTWIGYPAQNAAWIRLARARDAVQSCPDPAARAHARDHLLVAEGSDWFWWYGPHHTAAHEPVFDRVFREHVAAAYREIGLPIPPDLG